MVEQLQNQSYGDKKLCSILHSVNTSSGQTVGHQTPEILWGRPSIYEQLLGLTFQISPYSFFQTNTQGAEILYRKVIEWANLTGQEVVYDLYCGTGTIGILLAQQGAKKVYGLEEIPEAVEDAQENALRNRLYQNIYI